jgi:hypothetical protein
MIKRVPVKDLNDILKRIEYKYRAFMSNKKTHIEIDDEDYDRIVDYLRNNRISVFREDPVHSPNLFSCYYSYSLY